MFGEITFDELTKYYETMYQAKDAKTARWIVKNFQHYCEGDVILGLCYDKVVLDSVCKQSLIAVSKKLEAAFACIMSKNGEIEGIDMVMPLSMPIHTMRLSKRK